MMMMMMMMMLRSGGARVCGRALSDAKVTRRASHTPQHNTIQKKTNNKVAFKFVPSREHVLEQVAGGCSADELAADFELKGGTFCVSLTP